MLRIGHRQSIGDGPFIQRLATRGLLSQLPALPTVALTLKDSLAGTITETEATYINPVARFLRTSDGALVSYPASGLEANLEAFGNEEVVVDSLDFTSDLGFIKTRVVTSFGETLSGNSDWMMMYATADSGSHQVLDLARPYTFAAGRSYRLTAQVYLPSGQTNVNGLLFLVGNTTEDSGNRIVTTTDTVVDVDYIFTPSADNDDFRLYLLKNSSTVAWAGANDPNDDQGWVRNVQVTQLTHNVAAVPYDVSGNGNHFAQATAASQPLVVEAGTVVKDANGNLSNTWGGVDDDLTLTGDYSGLTSANVYVVSDNAGTVTLDTLTGQDLSLDTAVSDILASITYDKLTAMFIYPDASNQSAIQSTLNQAYGIS